MEKCPKKRKVGKKNPKKPLRKKAKRERSLEGARKGNESLQKSAEKEMVSKSLLGKVEEKEKSSKQNAAEKASSTVGESEKSPEKPPQEEETLEKSLTKPENKAKIEAVRSMGFSSFLKFDLKQIARKLSKCRMKNCYCSKFIMKYVKDVNQIASPDWCQFIMDKLISSVRNYKESKAVKGVHSDSLLFFLIGSSPIQQAIPS
ncbi:hypothetical protein Cgig2_024218 [Carnegiea gigantea]|uniref:Uncharacterized protein n=1 Tax=Carnegiea gigantea TaxID=171969 RepID=A0A9Q1GMX7_9CARY|nr:hypothetical protein Cgig2_024218 [Carnegiea gigantea]